MNGSSGSLEKATIVATEGANKGQPIKCLYNPKEFTIQKQNNWQRGQVKGKDVPQLEFSGGNASTLQMELFFDTYEDGKDVRNVTK